MLHDSIPGLEDDTVFPLPQEICEMCREQLCVAFGFRKLCMATNREMYKMWMEAKNLQRTIDDINEESKVAKEEEFRIKIDLENYNELDPIKLEDRQSEYKIDTGEAEQNNGGDFIGNGSHKVEILHGESEDEDDNKPLICWRIKHKTRETNAESLDLDDIPQTRKGSNKHFRKHIRRKCNTKSINQTVNESIPPESRPYVKDISLSEIAQKQKLEIDVISDKEDFRESDFSESISDDVDDNIGDKSEGLQLSLKKHKCTQCKASFRFEKQLERHLKKHTEAHRFVCPMCSDLFKYLFMLQKHVAKHHPDTNKPPSKKVEEISKTAQEKSHSCNYCSAAYTNVGGLAQHMSKKHPKIVPFKCDKCDKTFVVEEHLKVHNNRHMGIKNFKCDLCDKSFSFKFAMKQHMRIHTGDLNYLCTLCGKKFYRPSNLRQHMQRHGEDKPYTCPHCPKRFKCPSDRYIHLMSHQEGKNHVCSTCGSRFSRVDTLHQHQILHTGEKPYKCDQCPMAFPRLMNLNRHLRTHTGEKPYRCKYCDKAYAQSNDLNKHLRTHVGENTYMCSQCPLAFKYQAELRSHEWEHYRQQQERNVQIVDDKCGKDKEILINIEMENTQVGGKSENK